MASQQHRLVLAVNKFEEPRLSGNSVVIARPYVKLRDASGQITEAGRRYERLVAERGDRRRYEHTHIVHPDEQPEHRDGDEYLKDISGQVHKTRSWNPAGNGGRGEHRFTPFGVRAGHSSVRYTVQVPVWRTFIRKDGRHVSYAEQRSGEPFLLPIDSDLLGTLPLPGDLRVARNVGDHERQKAFIKEALTEYLSKLQPDENGNLVLSHFEQSDAYYTIDPRMITGWRDFLFSTEVEHFRADHAPITETILNRPLQGVPRVPYEMLWKLDLIPEALKDYDGRCVAHQLLAAVAGRSRVGRNARSLFSSLEDIEVVLDDLEFELYPGRYEGPPPPDLPDAKRELEPYVPLWEGYIPPYRPKELFECEGIVRKAKLTQRADLPPLAGVLRKHGVDLATFFKLFPDTFRVIGTKVVYWQIDVDDDVLEQRSLPKAETLRA